MTNRTCPICDVQFSVQDIISAITCPNGCHLGRSLGSRTCRRCKQEYFVYEYIYGLHTCPKDKTIENATLDECHDEKPRPQKFKHEQRNCRNCGKAFTINAYNHELCSDDCRLACNREIKKIKKPEYDVTCHVCGDEFKTSRPDHKYCSADCRRVITTVRMSVTGRQYDRVVIGGKTCPVCDYDLNTDTQVFCSKFCRDIFLDSVSHTPKYRNGDGSIIKIKLHTCRLEYRAEYTYPSKRIKNKSQLDRRIPILWIDVFGNTSTDIPVGHYVYGWINYYESNFPFYIGEGQSTRAWDTHFAKDNERSSCELNRTRKTVVVIYRQRLTKEGSKLLESVLTDMFMAMGATLYNRCEQMKRTEIPPLNI
jgi:predicted nucleic acid-binding Zn ribbon protein